MTSHKKKLLAGNQYVKQGKMMEVTLIATLITAMVLLTGILVQVVIARKTKAGTTAPFRFETQMKKNIMEDPNAGDMLRQTELMRIRCLDLLRVIESKYRWRDLRLWAEDLMTTLQPLADQSTVFHNFLNFIPYTAGSDAMKPLQYLRHECSGLLGRINDGSELLLHHISYNNPGELDEICEDIRSNLLMVLNRLNVFSQEAAFSGKDTSKSILVDSYKKQGEILNRPQPRLDGIYKTGADPAPQ